MLKIDGLSCHYGRIQALHDVALEVNQGELVALVGGNGAGKSTLLRAISGLHSLSAGAVRFENDDISRMPAAKRVSLGIAQVPEGRQVFGPLAVEDNIRLGAYSRRDKAAVAEDMERMYDTFPILRNKRGEAAGTLSGGQQQMLAIARALMARPRLLLLDEPSMGLAPVLVTEIFNIIRDLKAQGTTILLVEQNAFAALGIADRGYVLETGRITLTGRGPDLLADDQVKQAYLGI
ncbi:ABC transporter ATP-binding protein [Magnetospira sp. QH-2]|uniref:ABC transporter ATP-binding protein n=1 Tax=Magnetospira sp. (strain QH-2) TaxID=1288970 RepID=UPI0035289D0C